MTINFQRERAELLPFASLAEDLNLPRIDERGQASMTDTDVALNHQHLSNGIVNAARILRGVNEDLDLLIGARIPQRGVPFGATVIGPEHTSYFGDQFEAKLAGSDALGNRMGIILHSVANCRSFVSNLRTSASDIPLVRRFQLLPPKWPTVGALTKHVEQMLDSAVAELGVTRGEVEDKFTSALFGLEVA